MSALPPFDPPYQLGGSCFSILGLWEGEVAEPAPPGFRPIRIFGRALGMVIVNDYQRPPDELPIRYREVIAAQLVRRGFEVAVLPFDMALDAEVPVDLGRLHYSLPKRFDASLVVESERGRFSARGDGFELEAHLRGVVAEIGALPIRLAFGLGVRAVTSIIDVLGASYGPLRRARIALRPSGVGASFRVSSAIFGDTTLKSLWSQSWTSATTWLGPPTTVEHRR